MRKLLPMVGVAVVLLLSGISGAGVTTRPATQPATQESVASMKVRLEKLKAQAVELEAKIAAVEAKEVEGVSLIKPLNQMPKKYWPVDDENRLKREVRSQWLTDNIKIQTPHTLTGTVISVERHPQRNVDGVHVVLDCGEAEVWGKQVKVFADAYLTNVTPERAADWEKDKRITVVGEIAGFDAGGDTLKIITAENAKLK